MTKAEKWFQDNVIEDADKNKEIGDQACRVLFDVLNLGIGNNDSTSGKIAMALYGIIFESMCNVVVQKEQTHDSYDLNMVGAFHIGYTTTESEDDEKQGNFMVYMDHIENPNLDKIIDDEGGSTLEKCIRWNAENIKVQAETNKDVAVKALTDLRDVANFSIQTHEFIPALFAFIHAQIIRYVRKKRVELGLNEYEISIAGLYTVGCSIDEDANEQIYFVPSITLKLLFKNDSIASSAGDD